MDLIYKKADIEDIQDLIKLRLKLNRYFCNNDFTIDIENELKNNIEEVLLKELNKTIYYFISKENSKAIACSGIIIHQMIPYSTMINGKKAYITSVYTDEEYRHQGIQRKLIQMCIDFAKEECCESIELDATNINAIKLYEGFGFKRKTAKFYLAL